MKKQNILPFIVTAITSEGQLWAMFLLLQDDFMATKWERFKDDFSQQIIWYKMNTLMTPPLH